MAKDLLGNFFVKNAAERLRGYIDQSGIDDLTGLRLSKEFFKLASEKLDDSTNKWCVVTMDIEHFKLLNEWYGRATGDIILMQIGNILQMLERSIGALSCYMMGDNFCFMLPYDKKRIERIYDQIKKLVSQQGNHVGFLPAFGICVVENNEDEILDIYDRAMVALQHAKEGFTNRIVYFDNSMLDSAEKEYRILLDFHEALENGDIRFFLQPQCRASKGTVVGAEALARWIKEDGTFISPAVFVPILERYGFVTTLDLFIWEKVCEWLRKMIDMGYSPVPVSVNISRVDIYNIDVPKKFKELIDKYKLPSALLKAEITETAYGQDMTAVEKVVEELKDSGFAVLMDDFGSGYSSLNMLKSTDMDIIKIDAKFLETYHDDEKKSIGILESIMNMTLTMGTPVVVEGVETEKQVKFLRELGCRYMQGFFFFRPMPVDEFEKIIADKSRLDLKGIRFKAKNQMHIREFLDDNIYSDNMLNSILGAVSYYKQNGKEVYVTRYNDQMLKLVGNGEPLPDSDFRIDTLVEESDLDKFYQILDTAYNDKFNGAEGIIRFKIQGERQGTFYVRAFNISASYEDREFYVSYRNLTRIGELEDKLKFLSNYIRSTIVFSECKEGKWHHSVVLNGLENSLGMSSERMEKELEDATFYNRIVYKDKEFKKQIDGVVAGNVAKAGSEIDIIADGGKTVTVHVSIEMAYMDGENGIYVEELYERNR